MLRVAHLVRRALLAALLPTLFTAPPALAAVSSFGPPARAPVGLSALRPLRDARGTFQDKYTLEGRLKGGGDVYFSIYGSYLGVGRRAIEVKARYRAPDGTEHVLRDKLDYGDISESADGELNLVLGRHQLRGKPGRLTFTAEGDDLRMEVTFHSTTPPWRPGSGRATFGGDADRYLDMTLLAPRARLRGQIRVGGEERAVKGVGYALHTYSTIAPHELAKRMVGFRTERGNLVFYFKEIVPDARWDGAPLRWLLVARGREVLFESTDFSLTEADFQTDTAHESHYRVPRVLRIEARDGDRRLVAVTKVTKKRSRSDRLAGLSAVERAVASRFAKPVSYTYFAAYQVRIEDGDDQQEFKGRGIYEVDHVNK